MLFDVLMARCELYRRADRMLCTYAPDVSPLITYMNREDLPFITRAWGVLVVTETVFRERYFDLSDGHDESPVVLTAIIEAKDLAGDVVDLIGWPIDDPSRFRSMFGNLAILGEGAVNDPITYTFDKALDIYATPLAWMKARCNGIVCLDLPNAARILIDAPGQICCRDKAHAFALRAAMQAIVAAPIKRIVVPLEAV